MRGREVGERGADERFRMPSDFRFFKYPRATTPRGHVARPSVRRGRKALLGAAGQAFAVNGAHWRRLHPHHAAPARAAVRG
jgi:hypothetical protein